MGRAISSLASIAITVLLVVWVARACDSTANGLHRAANGLNRAAQQLQQAENQAQNQAHQAFLRAVSERQRLLDGKPCQSGSYHGHITVEGPTASNPGRADCL